MELVSASDCSLGKTRHLKTSAGLQEICFLTFYGPNNRFLEKITERLINDKDRVSYSPVSVSENNNKM